MSKDEQAKKAIDDVFTDGDDDDETLGRLQALHEYIEHLMDRIR